MGKTTVACQYITFKLVHMTFLLKSLIGESLSVRDKVTSSSTIDKCPYVLQPRDYDFHMGETLVQKIVISDCQR